MDFQHESILLFDWRYDDNKNNDNSNHNIKK